MDECGYGYDDYIYSTVRVEPVERARSPLSGEGGGSLARR